jgi:acyl-CoA oxidase
MKLFPIIGKLFACIFSGEHALNQLNLLLKGIEEDDFSKLDLMHHYTAGMKALFSQDAFDHNIQIRQALGGAGYSAWSNIPRFIEDCSPFVTFEGDNTVMLQ